MCLKLIKAWRLEILECYDVDLSEHSALFTWLVRHTQWLVNRYFCNAEGTTAFERRWCKKYAGLICRFGETVRLYFSTQNRISTLLLTAVVSLRPVNGSF